MKARIQALLIAVASLLLAVIIVIINTSQRERDFERQQTDLQQTLVRGASYAISRSLLQQQQQAHLFVDEYRDLIQRLAQTPDHATLEESIRQRLHSRFPDLFTFTITTLTGEPLLESLDTLLGQVCLRDIRDYSSEVVSSGSKHPNSVFIHPNPKRYHYDLMVVINSTTHGGLVFFISLVPETLMDILKTHRLPGHNLMLVKNSDPSLIEIAAEGMRDTISRDIRLTKSEMKSIQVSEVIQGADWKLVDIRDQSWSDDYKRNLWTEAATIVLILLIAVALLVVIIFRATRRSAPTTLL